MKNRLLKKITAMLCVCSIFTVQNITFAGGMNNNAESNDYSELNWMDLNYDMQLIKAMESQDKYSQEYDLNEDGKVTFADAMLVWDYRSLTGGSRELKGKDAYSEYMRLDVNREDDVIKVDVMFLYKDRIKNGGFDCAVLYNKDNLKMENFEWSEEFLEALPVESEEHYMAGRYLQHKEMQDYVLMTGIYTPPKVCTDTILYTVATITFSILNDKEDITSEIELVNDATLYKNDIEELKANTCLYVKGTAPSADKLNLDDVVEYLQIVLGIFDVEWLIYDGLDFNDLTGDGKLTLQDASAALRQALGIDPPIYLKWDRTTFEK